MIALRTRSTSLTRGCGGSSSLAIGRAANRPTLQNGKKAIARLAAANHSVASSRIRFIVPRQREKFPDQGNSACSLRAQVHAKPYMRSLDPADHVGMLVLDKPRVPPTTLRIKCPAEMPFSRTDS